jgi:HAD superfamily hydrolase (TIGR01509 family)
MATLARPSAPDAWPVPRRVDGVVLDIHSTLVDQGGARQWLDLALARTSQGMDAAHRADTEAFLDRIWEGARVSDPTSSRDLSFADHERVFHGLIEGGPGIDRALSDALYAVMLDTWHAYDDAVPMLQELRSLGVRTCLLSNAGVDIRSVLDREAITGWYDHAVLSYEVGAVKPDVRIFAAALAALDLPAASVLMVGDNAHDDGGGAALGIRTLILPRTSGRIHGLAAVPALVRGINDVFG